MSVKLQPLPYDYSALAPHISEDTVKTHYEKHHRHYVETLNELIKGTEFDQMKLQDIVLRSADKTGDHLKIFNNAGQAWNHQFYWNSLAPSEQRPGSALTKILEKSFGSFDKFQVEFLKKSAQLFGSGWVWLVADNGENLSIQTTQNADNPLTTAQAPLLTCDVWEHAYYLDYKNERDKYSKSIWQIINWNFVESNFENRAPSGDMFLAGKGPTRGPENVSHGVH